MLDYLPYAYLFNVEMILEWIKHFFPLLTIKDLRMESMDHNLSMIELSKEYSMLARRFYRLEEDGVLMLSIKATKTL